MNISPSRASIFLPIAGIPKLAVPRLLNAFIDIHLIGGSSPMP